MKKRRRIAQYRDPRYCHTILDANALDRVDQQRSKLVDEFQHLVENLPLSLFNPYGVENEVRHQSTPTKVQNDMRGIFTIRTNLTLDEDALRQKIRKILKGNSSSDQHNADSDHIFEAYKYGGGYFITHDNRFKKKILELSKLLDNITIVTLKEFISIAHQLDN